MTDLGLGVEREVEEGNRQQRNLVLQGRESTGILLIMIFFYRLDSYIQTI